MRIQTGKRIAFIIDRGYYNREQIRYMDRSGYESNIMIIGMKELVKRLDLQVEGNRSIAHTFQRLETVVLHIKYER